MLHRLARTAISFLVVLAAYWAYLWIAVPWIEPAPLVSSGSLPPPPTETNHHAIFATLFPENAWQRTSPKVLETEQGVLLFQDYHPTPDGKMELKPLTLVLHRKSPGNESAARAVVIDAPDGAQFTFDSPPDLAHARMGKFLGGRLLGDIHIFSPPSEPLADDAFSVRTRGIQLDERSIWTTQAVVFRFGPHHGSGRDLRIDLTPYTQIARNDAGGNPFGPVRLLELAIVEKVYLQMKGQGLLGSEPNDSPNDVPVPIEITCRGPFKFDFTNQTASLNDQVEAVRLNLDGPSDRLTCQLLAIRFENQGTDKTPELRIGRFEAQGHPVMLQAPSVDALAQAENVEYDFGTRRIRLDDSHNVTLRHKTYQIQAPAVEYEIPEDPQRLGRMWAAGPGDFKAGPPKTNGPDRAADDDQARRSATGHRPSNSSADHSFHGPSSLSSQPNPKQTAQGFHATWRRELRMEPSEEFHVLSLLGEVLRPGEQPGIFGGAIRPATAEAVGVGWFAASEIHVWLREMPAAEDADTTRPAIEPDRLLALRTVEFDSARISGGTERLEVWLREGTFGQLVPIGGNRSASPATVRGNSPPQGFGMLANNATEQKFDVRCELLKLHMIRQGSEVRPDQAALFRRVRVRQISGGKSGGDPLTIAGDELQMRGLAEQSVQAVVTGQPAEVSAEGMTLAGAAVQLDQSQNMLWSQGGGQITLAGSLLAARGGPPATVPSSIPPGQPPADSVHSQSSSRAAPASIRWAGTMIFDGLKARCEKAVEVEGVHLLDTGSTSQMNLRGDSVEATLTRHIDFRRPDSQQAADLQHVVVLGSEGLVQVASRTLDPTGAQQSFDQLRAPRLSFNKQTGDFDAAGPGWVSTVRYLSDPLTPKADGARPTGTPAYLETKLNYMRVDYQRAILGNVHRREVQFVEQVAAVSGPVRSWDEVLVVDRLERLRDDEKRLTCERLTVTEMTDGRHRWLELEATGNTVAEGRTKMGFFTAAAQRASYTQVKDLLVLESNGREDAKLTRQLAIGSPESKVTARKIEFRPKTNELNLDGIGSINLSDMPNSQRR